MTHRFMTDWFGKIMVTLLWVKIFEAGKKKYSKNVTLFSSIVISVSDEPNFSDV